MAKASKVVPAKTFNKKGVEKPEYPKLIKIGDGEVIAGKMVGNKVLVNSAEEEAEIIKEHGLDKPETSAKKNW